MVISIDIRKIGSFHIQLDQIQLYCHCKQALQKVCSRTLIETGGTGVCGHAAVMLRHIDVL